MQSLKCEWKLLSYIGGNMRLKVLLVLASLCIAFMASSSLAQGPWKIKTTIKKASTKASGTITPNDTLTNYVEVANGANITFTITPGPGSRVASMMAGNYTVFNSGTYTFYHVTHDDSILVRFEVNPKCYSTPDTCYVCRDSSVTPWALKGFDLGVCDTLRFGVPVCAGYAGSGAVAIGDSFKVPFYIYNSHPLGAFSLGFLNSGRHVFWGKGWSVDTASSIPPAARGFMTPPSLTADRDTVLIGWADLSSANPIPATTGGKAKIVGSLYVVLQAASSDTFQVDSIFVLPSAPFLLTAINSPGNSRKLTPQFVPGVVHIIPECPTNPVMEVNGPNLPQQYSLGQNVPNPFNPSTSIEFAIPRSGDVKIEVFNILGQKVRTLVDEYLKVGYKRVDWDGTDQSGNSVASGVYLYRMSSKDFSDSKKMLLLK